MTLTSREDIEQNLLYCNKKHSLQALSTPFFTNPNLAKSLDPFADKVSFSKLMDGSLVEDLDHELSLSEKEWISALRLLVEKEISLHFSLDDFKHFFKLKQECTASSPSGQHFGHYKTLLECIH